MADAAFLEAYNLLSPATVFEQQQDEDELEAMFRVSRLPADTIWTTRTALRQLQTDMNDRCVGVLLGWLRGWGLQPDAASSAAQQGL